MSFESRLKEGFEQMAEYRTAVGYTTAAYKSSVLPFITFCVTNHPEGTSITQDMLDGWLSCHPYSDNGKAAFLSRLREYTKFLHFLGYDDFIPDGDYTVKRTAYNPFLFTDGELRSLFHALDCYRGRACTSQHLPEMVLPVYSRMLYCCGMRPQEPPALRREDIDLATGDVYIRQSKRHKDRHILLSDDMLDLCIKYDSLAGCRDWFFQRRDGRPYHAQWYYRLFNKACSKSGITGRGRPRPYDLRHSFASRNLIRWLEDGRDAMELLPYLCAYMGHSELTSTLYYIHLLPENLRRSVKIDWERFRRVYGKAVSGHED